MNDQEKEAIPSDAEQVDLPSNQARVARELVGIADRIEALDAKRQALELKAWKDPGPHHREELEFLEKQHEELSREAKDRAEKLEARLEALRGERSSLKDEMRSDRGRMYDLHKHITTLSTASILGVAALSELFPTNLDLKSGIAISLICFLVSIVLAILAMFEDNTEMLAIGVNYRCQDRASSSGKTS